MILYSLLHLKDVKTAADVAVELLNNHSSTSRNIIIYKKKKIQ